MASGKLVAGGAAATAALGVRVARSLYGRWRMLPERDRRRTESLAADLKHRALELRGAADPGPAGDGLRAANETLAAALVDSAESDPEVSRRRGERAARRAQAGARTGLRRRH